MGHGGEGCGRMNTVQIIYKHVCKCKMKPFETFPGMGGEQWSGWTQVWYIWYSVRTFVNSHTPQQ
jgi:hypothetical protein